MPRENPKTLKDYLLEGGVKGKTFHHLEDNWSFFYVVKGIDNKTNLKEGSYCGEQEMIFYSKFGKKEIENLPIRCLLTDKEADPSELEKLAQSQQPQIEEPKIALEPKGPWNNPPKPDSQIEFDNDIIIL